MRNWGSLGHPAKTNDACILVNTTRRVNFLSFNRAFSRKSNLKNKVLTNSSKSRFKLKFSAIWLDRYLESATLVKWASTVFLRYLITVQTYLYSWHFRNPVAADLIKPYTSSLFPKIRIYFLIIVIQKCWLWADSQKTQSFVSPILRFLDWAIT